MRALVCALVFLVRSYALCPGTIDVAGYGSVSLVTAGYNKPEEPAAAVDVLGRANIRPHLTGRAYFSDTCTDNYFSPDQYVGLKLLGKTFRYTTDVSGLGCGCNAAMYLVAMRQNTEAGTCGGDYYCDANKVCGVYCSEIDIQEANQYAWHSTLHTSHDSGGKGGGYGGGNGWQGPRDWTSEQYGPGGSCVDTALPFQVEISFPVDANGALTAVEVTLSQTGKDCKLTTRIADYMLQEMGASLAAGMTPVVSYWAADDMLWLDGRGTDNYGGCLSDHKDTCPDSASFSDFSVADIGEAPPAVPVVPPLVAEDSSAASENALVASEDTSDASENNQVPSEVPYFVLHDTSPAPSVGSGAVYEPSSPPASQATAFVAEGCHTLSEQQCCSYMDGRPAHYGSRCVVVTGVTKPKRDMTIPCQPASWVDGSTEWEGTVIGCPGLQVQTKGSGPLFGWLPNPFKGLMMKDASPSPSAGVVPGAVQHVSPHNNRALDKIGSLICFSMAGVLLFAAVRIYRQHRGYEEVHEASRDLERSNPQEAISPEFAWGWPFQRGLSVNSEVH